MDAGLSVAEVVTRPDPGLARGIWEAPPWFFWALVAFGALASALYVVRRFREARARRSA